MMIFHRRATVTGALLLALTGTGLVSANGIAQAQQYGYEQNRGGWDQPPAEMQSAQQRMGFHDGIAAAQDDLARHLRPNATARDEYRHPPDMPFLQRAMYRDGFTRGYQRVIDFRLGQMQQPVPPQPMPPPPSNPGYGYRDDRAMHEIRHRGFQEGMNGALQDMDNHRRPDPNNRDEYRNPPMPPPASESYRDGFRHGYNAAMHALNAMPSGWQMGQFGSTHVQGFRDGAAGAIRDYDNQRRPDVNNRDEYRHPNMPPPLADAYRDGFRQGYTQIANELMGYFGRR